MAGKEVRPTEIEELITIEQLVQKAKDSFVKQSNEKNKHDRIAQEKAINDFRMALQETDLKKIEKLQIEFLKEYEKKKRQSELKLVQDTLKEQLKASKKKVDDETKLLEKQNKHLAKAIEHEQKAAEEGASGLTKVVESLKAKAEADRAANADLGNKVKESMEVGRKHMMSGLANLGDKLSGEINSVISTYSQYQSAINTRLQGTSQTFQSVEKKLTSTLGMSPYVKTSSMLESLNELVAQGIAFNIEQRAFLDTIGEKIATTFDVANASLLRIVRLQQADSTASRLGMEAYLTRFYNDMFQNTEYLSTTFDNVTAALLEATSQMETKPAVEFEYIVQKWLGSLSAVGTSESTVQALAQALGYLGSGNVAALSGTEMQNLLVMAASKAGLDYSSMLTEGLNAYTTNSLLQAVVGYMQEIGQGSNQVVRSQYAKTFGVTISDLTAVANLDLKDLNTITKNMMSYSGTLDELGYQLDQINERVSVAEKIQNLMTNIKFGIGQGIAQSPVMAGMWSITDLIQGVTGGIAIPAISVMGNMVDLNTTVENLIKTGIVGVSTLGKIGDLFTGLSNAANMSNLIQAYNIDELQKTTRGRGLATRARGISTSISTLVGTTSGSEIGAQSLQAAQTEAGAIAEQQKSSSIEKSTTDIYQYLLNMFDPKMNSLLTMIGSMSGYNVGLTSWDKRGEEERNYVFSYGTEVKVSPAQDVKTGENLQKIANIETAVSNINTLLTNGISVTVKNMPLTF